MYDLHSLHGQFSDGDVSFLNAFGTVCQILEPRNRKLSVPQKHFLHLGNQILKTVINCNHYSLVDIIVSR